MRIREIYYTLQGESLFSGLPSILVRTAFCPIGCAWCDTPQTEPPWILSADEIITEIQKIDCRLVTLTGGEPLLENDIHDLERRLLDSGYRVLLETSGLYPIDGVAKETHIVMDVKCPGSGVTPPFLESNLTFLKPTDEVKFVIHSLEDARFAFDCIKTYRFLSRTAVSFSITHTATLSSFELARWILLSHLPIRFQPPLHATFWKNERQFHSVNLNRYPRHTENGSVDLPKPLVL